MECVSVLAPVGFCGVLIIVASLHLLLSTATPSPLTSCPRGSSKGINFTNLQQRIMLALLLTLLNSMIVHDDSGEGRLNRMCVYVLSRLWASHPSPNTQRAGMARPLHWHHQATAGGVFIVPGDTEGPGGSEYHVHINTCTYTHRAPDYIKHSLLSNKPRW